MIYVVKITDPRRYPIGPYLQGPRTPQQVRRDGFGFTSDIGQAWPFATLGEARRKASAVNRHMAWGCACEAVNEKSAGTGALGRDEFLAAFGLGPRPCEDCGEVFTVPPYMECKKWKFCTSCSGKRFHEWIKTSEAKKTLELFEQRNFPANKELAD
jgi:hypothetical protein